MEAGPEKNQEYQKEDKEIICSNMNKVNVLLSGGVGSRLWPLSRKSRPKQYLPMFEGKTLFQKTISRNQSFCDSLLVVGNKDNFELSRKDLANFPGLDFSEIIEACPRNTAAAIAFAAFTVNPDDVLFVTPSDHLIVGDERYSQSVREAMNLAEEGHIVTFGLKPSHPETGFGYIEHQGHEVLSFREKPDADTAALFLKQGNFLWNSGMFCFQAGVYLSELEKLAPKVFTASKKAFDNMKDGFLDESLSMDIPSISVDYAVMEKTDKIKVVASGFDWSDMGSFASIFEYLQGQGYPVDKAGNLFIGDKDMHVEFVGVSDSILVHTEDAILVVHKDAVQGVKQVFERLEKDNPDLVE